MLKVKNLKKLMQPVLSAYGKTWVKDAIAILESGAKGPILALNSEVVIRLDASGAFPAVALSGLLDVLKFVGSKVAEFSVEDESTLKVTVGTRTKLVTCDKLDGPLTLMKPTGARLNLHAQTVKSISERSTPSTDEGRPNLNNIVLVNKQVISTDGHRATIITDLPIPEGADVQLPAKAFALAVKAKAGMNFTYEIAADPLLSSDTMAVIGASYVVYGKRGSQYPDMFQVISSRYSYEVDVKRDALLSALTEFAQLTKMRKIVVCTLVFSADGTLKLVEGSSEVLIPNQVVITYTSDNFRDYPPIGFNPRYLLDAVRAAAPGQDLHIGFNKDDEIARMASAGLTTMLMPMRIGSGGSYTPVGRLPVGSLDEPELYRVVIPDLAVLVNTVPSNNESTYLATIGGYAYLLIGDGQPFSHNAVGVGTSCTGSIPGRVFLPAIPDVLAALRNPVNPHEPPTIVGYFNGTVLLNGHILQHHAAVGEEEPPLFAPDGVTVNGSVIGNVLKSKVAKEVVLVSGDSLIKGSGSAISTAQFGVDTKLRCSIRPSPLLQLFPKFVDGTVALAYVENHIVMVSPSVYGSFGADDILTYEMKDYIKITDAVLAQTPAATVDVDKAELRRVLNTAHDNTDNFYIAINRSLMFQNTTDADEELLVPVAAADGVATGVVQLARVVRALSGKGDVVVSILPQSAGNAVVITDAELGTTHIIGSLKKIPEHTFTIKPVPPSNDVKRFLDADKLPPYLP